MKNSLPILSLLAAVAAFLAACSSAPKSQAVLLDPLVEKSIECGKIQERFTPDGRLEVLAYVHNLENRRLQVQVNCVFKDENGFPTEGDETPFRNLILTENAEEPVMFTSLNDKAKICVIRIREAH
jgi:hypothetical protein